MAHLDQIPGLSAISQTHSTAAVVLLALVGGLITYTLYHVVVANFSSQALFWSRQDWVGKQQRMFADFWARSDALKQTRSMITDGYARFSKQGRTFALPRFAAEPMVMLPPNKIKTLLQKPDEDINLLVMLRETMAIKYNWDQDIHKDPFHLDVVRHQLVRKVPLLTNDVHSELILGFEAQWNATGDNWKTVTAFRTCANIISRAANRVFSGPELCRNQEYLDHAREYGQGVFANAGIINMLPLVLRWPVGALLNYRNDAHARACLKIARPVIEQRLAEQRSGKSGKNHNDALQWIVEECIKRNDPAEQDLSRICRRILRLNTVAIHTTSISITHAIFDLYGSDRTPEFVEGLREECERVLATHGGQWTKSAVNELYRVDSAIKESMRFSSLGMTGLFRIVTAESGIDLGDSVHIPYGVRIAAPIAGVHRDPAYYEHPDAYDAFRFSRSRESFDANGQTLDKRAQGIVTTSDSFLTFGHGRHACPGRFFASQEMKLMLAHIVMNYDVRIEGGRPKNLDINGACIPNLTAKIQVRLRQ